MGQREIHNTTSLLQETRKTSNKQSNFTLKETGKKQQPTKTKVSRMKKIIKVRVEINEIESEKTIQKINKIKS